MSAKVHAWLLAARQVSTAASYSLEVSRCCNQYQLRQCTPGSVGHRIARHAASRLWATGTNRAARWQPACRLCTTLATGVSSPGSKKQVVLLGTPEVAAGVLTKLLDHARSTDSSFEVAAVVTQPGKPKGRGNKSIPQPSPVELAAHKAGVPDARVLTPASARNDDFLNLLAQLQPDLCITAAYGNILPQRFLDIPRFGTLNIHPSLLPKYRGAAPVQRALQDGVAQTGVSVAFTVRAMDAGPVLAQEVVDVGPDIQASELLEDLFQRGCRLLLDNLDAVWEGRASAMAKPQDEAEVSHAAKVAKEEGYLDFTQPAYVLHAKVRAFAGWPGTFHTFLVRSPPGSGKPDQPLELKIIRTRLPQHQQQQQEGDVCFADQHVHVAEDVLQLRCGDGLVLEVLEVQPAGKKVMSAKAFSNGIKGRTLHWQQL